MSHMPYDTMLVVKTLNKKHLTIGNDGMIVTNNLLLFKDIKAMRWVGIDKDNWKKAPYTEINKRCHALVL
jgi:dTDP-4-amino-4,6-dideoxygalactose transaminase